MSGVERDAELDNLCLIFVRNSRTRVVTRHAALEEAIRTRFTYRHISWLRGKPRSELVPCYDIDRLGQNNHYYVGTGFLPTIAQMADQLGCPYEVYDVTTQKRQDVHRLEPLPMNIPRSDWEQLRSWQQDAVRFIRRHRRGRFGVATGSGKSFLIAKLCAWLKQSRVLLIAQRRQNLGDLYRACVKLGLDVQYIDGSSREDPTARVICCTTGSLGRLDGIRFDVAFGDEIHEHGAGATNAALWSVMVDRVFGFSANMEDRSDNADMWSEAIYGPVLLERTYQDNVRAGDVVQIRVRMLDMAAGPQCRSRMKAIRDRQLIWANRTRNAAFVEVAKHYLQSDKQILLLTNTTEHSLRLRKLLDVPVVFGDPNESRRQYFEQEGLLRPDDDFSAERNERVSREFSERKIPCVIANALWRQGKDFPSLDILLRLDATTSSIPNTQASGRLSRVVPGKEYGLLVDSDDSFEKGTQSSARKRVTFYRRQGWEVSYG